MSLLSFRLLLIMWPKYVFDTTVFIREPLRYSLAEGLALNLCPLKLSTALLFSLNFIPYLDAYVSHSSSNFMRGGAITKILRSNHFKHTLFCTVLLMFNTRDSQVIMFLSDECVWVRVCVCGVWVFACVCLFVCYCVCRDVCREDN